MELRHLRHFVAVAEELHFARAAERLGMEQSPLSQSIRNLEGELRIRLFHRTSRKTTLTTAGSRFYADAKRILNEVAIATASVRTDVCEGPQRVRLALAEDLAGEPFTRLLSQLQERHPELSVEIHELAHEDACHLVREGGADVALSLDGLTRDGLARTRACAEPLMLVVPLGHSLAERDQVELAEALTQPLAAPRREDCPGYAAQVFALLERHNLHVQQHVATNRWNTAISLAAAGRALALLPASVVAATTSAAVIAVAQPDAELVTWLFHREERSASVAVILEAAAQVAAEPAFYMSAED